MASSAKAMLTRGNQRSERASLMVQPIGSYAIGRIPVYVFESNEKLGQRAADDLAILLSQAIEDRGRAGVILATGNSQLTFFSALRAQKRIVWDKVNVFHMDEYLGMSDQHPASFARYIQENLVNHVHPAAFYPIHGDVIRRDVRIEALRRPAPRIQTRCVRIGHRGKRPFGFQ